MLIGRNIFDRTYFKTWYSVEFFFRRSSKNCSGVILNVNAQRPAGFCFVFSFFMTASIVNMLLLFYDVCISILSFLFVIILLVNHF